MKYEAIGNYILLKKLSDDDMQKSSGGIFVAGGNSSQVHRYQVVGVSNHDDDNKYRIRIGDYVWVNSGVVTRITLDDTDYVYSTIDKVILVEK